MNATYKEIRDLRDRFFAFEISENLFELTFRGIAFWDYVRCHVYDKLVIKKQCSSEAFQFTRSSKATLAVNYLREALLVVRQLFRHHFVLRSLKEVDLVFFDHGSKRLIDGRLVDFRTYPFLKHICGSVTGLIVDPSPLYSSVYGKYPCPVISSRIAKVFAAFRARLLFRLCADELEMLTKLDQQVEARFGVFVDIKQVFRDVFVPQYLMHGWVARLLIRWRPKLVGFLDDSHKKGVVEIAHRMGIKTFELQHGAVSPMFLASSYPEAVESMTVLTLPDHILTFGEYWAAQYNVPAQKIAVGFPFLEEGRKHALANTNRRRNLRGVLCVSVFSQELCRFLIELAGEMPEYQFYFRLRPEEFADWREIYPPKLQETTNIVVIDSDEVPLYEYFASVSYVLSSTSTALFEGIAFGLTVLVYAGVGFEHAISLVEKDLAYLVTRPEQARALIERTVSRKAGSLDSTAIFCENSHDRMKDAIHQLIATPSNQRAGCRSVLTRGW